MLDHPHNTYTTDAPSEAPTVAIALGKDDELWEVDTGFDYEGFQVVRREFFAHISEPSISFNNYKFYVNTACLSKFPDTEHVQVLVNQDTKILALRPCSDRDRDSFVWCSNSGGKRKPKQITCRIFFGKIMSLMGWNPDHRYKLLGKLIHANGEYLIAFDLNSTEVYQRTTSEGAKPKTSRTPVYPASWQNHFGLPFEEHKKSLQVNLFNGYAVLSISDPSTARHGIEGETNE